MRSSAAVACVAVLLISQTAHSSGSYSNGLLSPERLPGQPRFNRGGVLARPGSRIFDGSAFARPRVALRSAPMKFHFFAALVVVGLLAGCGTAGGKADGGTGGSGGSGGGAAGGAGGGSAMPASCDYLVKADIAGYYTGAGTISTAVSSGGCDYLLTNAGITDFPICNLRIWTGTSAVAEYNSFKSAAAMYGPVSAAAVGDQGYFSTEGPDSRNLYTFDIGFVKNGTTLVLICTAADTRGDKAQIESVMAKAAAKL